MKILLINRMVSYPIVSSEMEQVKKVDGSSIGCFHGYFQTLELFPPFGRKKFQHDIFLRSFGLVNRGRGNQEKRVTVSQRA